MHVVSERPLEKVIGPAIREVVAAVQAARFGPSAMYE
jgi:hypothetical protein